VNLHRCAPALLATLPLLAPAAPAPDLILGNGTVVTINDAQPLAEAVAVRRGRIVAVGTQAEVLALAGPRTRTVDLAGRTLLPGFVDSHGHAYMLGIQATTANLLPPPDGAGRDIPTLQRLLRDWAKQNPEALAAVGWIAGFGYDDSQLAEQRHPTRADLDAVSTDYPVVLVHQSAHLGAVNSKALELAGITAATPDPKGGVFRREAGSQEPNGVLEEYAFFYVVSRIAARFDDRINDSLVERGTALAASYGYTTVQEGRANQMSVDAMRRVARSGRLKVDLVAYPDILEVPDIRPSRRYERGFRVGGAKLTIDGSPQGKTAWLTQPYFVPPDGQPADYRGYAAVSPAVAIEAIDKAYANGWQLLVHANGDAGSDVLIDGLRRAEARHGAGDRRPVLIHGQVLREDQVDAIEALGVFPSLFPMHTFYWGDWHRDSVLGPARAENISPTGWVLARGMKFGTHHDAPVALPDSMRVLSATVTRRTRSGDILGPLHRVPVATALKSMTLWSAWQHFEEADKGSIETGKLADFVVLSSNPLTAAPDDIAGITVVETWKAGVPIYQRPADAAARVPPASFGVTPRDFDGVPEPGARAHGDGCINPALDVLQTALLGRLR
jgi:predicted amidohydrolase YtcJ